MCFSEQNEAKQDLSAKSVQFRYSLPQVYGRNPSNISGQAPYCLDSSLLIPRKLNRNLVHDCVRDLVCSVIERPILSIREGPDLYIGDSIEESLQEIGALFQGRDW